MSMAGYNNAPHQMYQNFRALAASLMAWGLDNVEYVVTTKDTVMLKPGQAVRITVELIAEPEPIDQEIK
jgi:hypothetical protein